MAYLILWDIDHTLIENAGVSKEIYGDAFMDLTGHRALIPAPTDGRTDPQIMREMLALNGVAERSWPDVSRALVAAGIGRSGRLSSIGYVLPGVHETVRRLRSISGTVQTVLTGNIRPNAEVKLGALGIAKLFDLDVGSYGSDHEKRSTLVGIAKRRARAKYLEKFERSNTVVIGDTPRDVAAGREGGASVLAVASGAFSIMDLEAAGADLVVPDLVGTEQIVDFLISGRR